MNNKVIDSTSNESDILCKVAEKLNLRFSYGGKQISLDDVFNLDGSLPLFYVMAFENCESIKDIVNLTSVVTLVPSEGLLGFDVISTPESFAMRHLVLVDAMVEMMRGNSISHIYEIQDLWKKSLPSLASYLSAMEAKDSVKAANTKDAN